MEKVDQGQEVPEDSHLHKEDYSANNNKAEDDAVFKIKSNSKYFFTFAKSRQNTRAKVGPFLDSDGMPNPSPDFAAESLRNNMIVYLSSQEIPGRLQMLLQTLMLIVVQLAFKTLPLVLLILKGHVQT